MEQKRPTGRKKYVTDNGKGVARRGEGRKTGPVGTGQQSDASGGRTGSSYTQKRSSGGGSLIAIIIAVIALLGGGGGLFGSGLLGGSSSSSSSSYLQDVQTTGIPSNVMEAITGTTSAGWEEETNTEETLDAVVAEGSREKRTQILGNGKDTVTLMIYMCGTDLESKSAMATRDLQEMAAATISDNVHVLVYTGGCSRWNNKIISSTQNQIYEVVSGGLKKLEDNMGTGTMTDPATLTSFIKWCTEKYPANRNELILWDHGGGSVSGYGYDEKKPRAGSMSLSKINQALSDAGTTFDFIGFDACLMATLETGLMLDKYADYMIASEETEPGIGWYYTNWLTNLSKNTSESTLDLGQDIVDDFVDACSRNCRGQSTTLSVVDLAELSNTVPESLKNFSNSLTELITNENYQQVSSARNGTREFATSSVIDQIDLVHFCKNIGNAEGDALADALLGAVKYNRTSSNMTNAYGISVYFPYRKASSVDAAVSNYQAIGMDDSYSQCIREFASLEMSGQIASGGTASPISSLLGGSLSSASSSDINSLLSAFLGGDYSSMAGSGLSSSNTSFFTGRSLSDEATTAYIESNYFDATLLTWQENSDGDRVIALPEEQWNLIEGLELNLFYDDGEGYVDLGLDNVFDFDSEGNLLLATDRTWLSINGQPVAYYHDDTQGEGDDAVITGHVPALLNGEQVELVLRFDGENPQGTILGAKIVYDEEETTAQARGLLELAEGDTLDFLCDYYTYDGTFVDSYYLGEPMTVTDTMEISNTLVGDGPVKVTYRFTDLYQQHYWTESVEVK